MILETASLHVIPGQREKFEADFRLAGKYISSVDGYLGHTLQRCLEQENKYLLLVKWRKLEDHTIGFRESGEYKEWKNLLHKYYDPFPVVEHYEPIINNL